jgi:hypothetical protein
MIANVRQPQCNTKSRKGWLSDDERRPVVMAGHLPWAGHDGKSDRPIEYVNLFDP